jgi:thymidylate kinase
MLAKLEALFTELDRQGVRYCQWKKNARLDEKLHGRGDLDLLLSDGQRQRFEQAVVLLGFLPAAQRGARGRLPCQHFFGLDECSGRLVHLDVYEELLAGGTLLKNYRLPLESLLFENLEWYGPVPAPSRGAELLLFVLRRLLASASPLEHVLLLRDFEDTAAEADWLASAATLSEAASLVPRYLPALRPELIAAGACALRRRSAVVERWRLGRQVERSLAPYRLRPPLLASLIRATLLARRLVRGRRSLGLAPRGAVIAVIGPDASGKSTTVREFGAWLGSDLSVLTAHAGKPPASAITLLARKTARLARRVQRLSIFPSFLTFPRSFLAFPRSFLAFPPSLVGKGPGDRSESSPAPGPLSGRGLAVQVVRSLMLAGDRWRLLTRAAALASDGVTVILDRYPTAEPGGLLDSAQLDPETLTAAGHRLAALLARFENRLYRRLPPPDIVVRLHLPLEVALQRNATRTEGGGPEPVAYVSERFGRLDRLRYPRSQVLDVDASGTLDQTLHAVKRAVWSALVSRFTADSEPVPVGEG